MYVDVEVVSVSGEELITSAPRFWPSSEDLVDEGNSCKSEALRVLQVLGQDQSRQHRPSRKWREVICAPLIAEDMPTLTKLQ